MINMRKEYRAELRVLDKAERHLLRDFGKHANRCVREIKLAKRSIERGRKATEKELERLKRRRAIVEGRLS